MYQPPAHPYQDAPPPKKSNKTWIIVGVIVVILCCVLAIAAGAGYYYFQTSTAHNSQPGSNLNPSQNGAGPASDQAGPKELEEIKKTGMVSLPFKLNVPDGMRVVKQVAIVAPEKDYPTLCDIYAAIVLENPTVVMDLNLDYQVWQYDPTGGPVYKATTGGGKTGTVIPLNQSGVVFWQQKGIRMDTIPVNLEITLKPMNYPQPMEKGLQASWDALHLTTLPNPFFKVVSAEIVANQQPSGSLYDIEANGKYINNLTVKNFAKGLFLFYDESGNITGFANSSWSKKQSGIIDPQGQGDLNGPIPYPLAIKPARVELYTYMDMNNVVNIQRLTK